MLMMAANVVNLTMLAFVNDDCNLLLMMAVSIAKMFFSNGFNMSLTIGQ
jgi:hypothetical protein